MMQSGWSSAPRCCREDTSLDVYTYIMVRCGTSGTTLSRCWNCPRTTYVDVKPTQQAKEEPERVVRAKNRREQLAKLPHNRKKMRY